MRSNEAARNNEGLPGSRCGIRSLAPASEVVDAEQGYETRRWQQGLPASERIGKSDLLAEEYSHSNVGDSHWASISTNVAF